MPVGASIAKLAATRAYGATVDLRRRDHRRGAGRRPGVRRPDRRGAGPPVRPSGHRAAARARSGWRSSSRCRSGHAGRRRSAAAGCSAACAAVSGDAARTFGSSGCRPSRPRPGRGRCPRAGPVRLHQMSTLADGIAVGEPTALTFAHVSDAGRRGGHGRRRTSCAGRCCCCWNGPSWSSSRPAPPPSRRSWPSRGRSPRRWWPCCPAATSTRWCCCTSSSTVSSRPAGSSACGWTSPTGPGRWPALLALLGESGANVLDVSHSRLGPTLALGRVLVEVQLECRGDEHATALVAGLGEAGFAAQVVTE